MVIELHFHKLGTFLLWPVLPEHGHENHTLYIHKLVWRFIEVMQFVTNDLYIHKLIL